MQFKEIYESLQCSKSELVKHIAYDPVNLRCGHLVCKQCLPQIGEIIKCEQCHETIEISLDVINARPNTVTKFFLQSNLSFLFENLEERYRSCLSDLNDSNLKYTIEQKAVFIEEDIEVKIESLKHELDNLKEVMINELHDKKKELLESLEEVEKKNKTKNLKNELQQTIDNVYVMRNELNQQNEENFFKFQKKYLQINLIRDEIKRKFDITFCPSNSDLETTIIGKIINPNDSREPITGVGRLIIQRDPIMTRRYNRNAITSDTFFVNGIPWVIKILPEEFLAENTSLAVECLLERDNNNTWSIDTKITLRITGSAHHHELIPQVHKSKTNFYKFEKTNKQFSRNFPVLVNPENQKRITYREYDFLKVEVQIEIKSAKGIKDEELNLQDDEDDELDLK